LRLQSHNPAIYNGIKVFSAGGRDADELLTQEIEKYIEKIDPKLIPSVSYSEGIQSGKIHLIDTMDNFVDSIIAAIDIFAIRDAKLKIVLDPMFGVSRTALQTILMTARCNVDVIHEGHDALFGGRYPSPTEKTLADLINFVEENHCDLGIATDGDADRLGVINDKAEFIHPNKILVMIYYYLMNYKGWRGPAVRNVATTHLLDRIAESFNETCYEVPVGFKHISSNMIKYNALIGGESSGGLTVRGHIQGKDGIYAAALLVEMIAVTGKSLSQLWQEIIEKYGNLEMIESNYSFSWQKKDEINQTLMLDKNLPLFPCEVERVSYFDGCKVYFKNGGWAVARFSGTEPLLRIFCEMETEDDAQDIIKCFQKFLVI
jgi:phosphomannomutase